MLVYLAISLVAGLLIANQTPINASLRSNLASPFWAATTSQLIASIFLAILSLISAGMLFPPLAFVHGHPLWIWIGGFLGPIYMTSSIFLFPKLGVVQTVIFPILGQVIMGVLIDSFGWIHSPYIPLDFFRIVGILIVVLGIIIAVAFPELKARRIKQARDRINTTKASNTFWKLLPYQIWGVLAGCLTSLQSSLNGHLGVLLGSAVNASFLSIFIGLLFLLVVTFSVERRLPRLKAIERLSPWHALGGIFGPLFIVSVTMSVPQIGTGLTMIMTLLGQITGSMLVQQNGLWRSHKMPISRHQVFGLLIMFLGVAIIKFM